MWVCPSHKLCFAFSPLSVAAKGSAADAEQLKTLKKDRDAAAKKIAVLELRVTTAEADCAKVRVR